MNLRNDVKKVAVVAFVALCAELGFAQPNFWQQANGPEGGSIYSFAVSHSGIVFAGTAGGGLFRSTDSCRSWAPVNIGVAINNVPALTVAPNGDIYASTEYVFGTSLTLAVYKSTNEGTTWAWASSGLSGVYFNSMAANSAGYIFIGSDGYGVFRSTNAGGSWTRVHGTPNTAEAYISSLAVNNAGHIFASSWLGVARSTNNGNTWQQLNMSLGEPYVRSLSVSPSGHIFGAAWNAGIVRSTNNGDSWSLVYSGVNDHTVFVASNGYVFFTEEWNTGGAIRRSTNNGSTWSVVLPLPNSSQARSFASLVNDAIIVAYGDDGVRLTTDSGGSWQRKNNGLRAISVQFLKLHISGYMFAGTFGGGVFRSSNNGIDWQQLNSGLTSAFVSSIAVQTTGVIYSGGGGIFRSSDLGNSWSLVRSDISANAMTIDETDAIFAGDYGRIFRSTDNGITWVIRDSGVISSWIQYIAVSPNGHIFAGTGNGMVRTTNKGESWDTVSLGWDVRSIAINSLGHIFVATAWGGGFLRSTNDGNSWTSINNGIGSFGEAIYVHPSGDLYAGSLGGGAYRSTNNGDSWFQINSGFTANTIFAFSLDNSGHLLAGTWGNAVFRSVQTTLSVADDPPQLPSAIVLYQNYPNPFNPTTTIRFSVPSTGFVSLKVFDLLGREIATIASGDYHAGMHSYTWIPSGIGSGVYYYRLQTGKSSITRKLNLLK